MRAGLIAGAIAVSLSLVAYFNYGYQVEERPPLLSEQPSAHRLSYAQIPLSFEPNLGQTDDEVKYLSRGKGYTLFLTADQAVLSLNRNSEDEESLGNIIRLQLVGSNSDAEVNGVNPLSARSHYLLGRDQTRWQRDVPHYGKVLYKQIYNGIDLVYYGTEQQQLEYDFIVAPDADPQNIQLQFQGMDSLYVDDEGNLVLERAEGNVVFEAPIAYQETNGTREHVGSRYAVGTANRIAFDVDAYDTSRPLIIDPILSYSTYVGVSGNEGSAAIAIDGSGSAYITGNTESLNYPTQNAVQGTFGGGIKDVFVTKLDPTGSSIVYSTYLGGSGRDRGKHITVDNTGNAYITGFTVSSSNFPLQNPLQPTYGGGNSDVFVVKLNAAGSSILYSTYLGGNGNDAGNSVTVDDSGNIYLLGYTTSTNFPVQNPIQSTNAGGEDVFLAKINASGISLDYSTYLGGSTDDLGSSLAVDSSGNAYLSGYATSSNFPLLNPIQASYGGGSHDAFVAKVNASGTSLIYSTYLGGNALDSSIDLAIDSVGNVYVTGWTDSPNFPLQAPFQGTHGGASDAFVAKLNASGSSLLYSTFLGGSSVELGKGIAVDNAGKIYLVGQVNSSNFPLRFPFQAIKGGGSNAFVTVFNPSGLDLVYSTYLGGTNGNDVGQDVAIDDFGNVYVAGTVGSTDFPTENAYQSSNGGGIDSFVAKLVSVPDLQIDGQIVYSAVPSGQSDGEIFRINADGTGVVQLTDNAFYDLETSWSSDGTRVVFATNTNVTNSTGREIFVMNADGSNLVQLTNNSAEDAGPAWSPDGAKIAFYSRRDGNYEIYLMNADGTNPVDLTNSLVDEDGPRWSPDGSKLTYRKNVGGNRSIYAIDPDGTNETLFIDYGQNDRSPTWSPSGAKVAFVSNGDTGPGEIYTANSDGSGITRLTNNSFSDGWPTWSPDGKRIFFSSERLTPNILEIYRMDADGSNEILLLNVGIGGTGTTHSVFQQIGASTVGTPVARTMTIKNNNSGDLIISNITADNAQFTIVPASFTVVPGGSQDVDITFTPTTAATTYSTLTISSNDPDSPSIALIINGTGQTPVVSVSLPNTTTPYNQPLSIPVDISSTTNLNIVAAEIFVAYDGDLLTAFSAGTTGTLAAGNWTVQTNVVVGNATNIDTLKIAMATDNDVLTGAGTLININFQVADQRSPASSPLTLSHMLFNDGNPLNTTTDGSVTIIGTDGSIASAPAQFVPREAITVTVTDLDEDLDGLANTDPVSVTITNLNNGDIINATLAEDAATAGTFSLVVPTEFALAALVDATIQAQAGDVIEFSFVDALDGNGNGPISRTAQSTAIGGTDGTVQITDATQPGDTVYLKVVDADLNTDNGIAETVQVVVTSSNGESETVTLTEVDIDDEVFFGSLASTSGGAGTNDNGTINGVKGDVLTLTYDDVVTALGDQLDRTDTDQVVDPFGDADGNGAVQAFDAAQTLLHVLSPFLTGLELIQANVDNDPAGTDITPFDASLILQKRVGLISVFPVQLAASTNHPQNVPASPKRVSRDA